MTLAVSKMKQILCNGCGKIGVPDCDIFEDSLPVTVKCGECGYEIQLLSMTDVMSIGKADPSKHKPNGGWFVHSHGETETVSLSDSAPTNQPESFSGMADRLMDILQQASAVSSKIIASVEQLAANMQADISASWSAATDFAVNVDAGMYATYLRCPFSFIRTPMLEDGMEDYSLWSIVPIFFNRPIGFPVGIFGGNRIGIVLPYSTLGFPLETWEKSVTGLPDPPLLGVFGNKIIGSSLREVWSTIPGTTPDEDHTIDVPSIKIVDKPLACRWLACHGVMPYSKMPVMESEIVCSKNTLDDILSKRLYKSAMDTLCRNGRIILAWNDYAKKVNFTSLVFSVVKGAKIFITSSEVKADNFRRANAGSFRNNVESESGKRHTSLAEPYTRFLSAEELNQFSMIAVDYSDGVPEDFIKLLYRYKGRIIAFATDPIMDALNENWSASLMYGLCGVSSFDPANTEAMCTPGVRTAFATALSAYK